MCSPPVTFRAIIARLFPPSPFEASAVLTKHRIAGERARKIAVMNALCKELGLPQWRG